MKKLINIPEIKIVRLESKDVIATSDGGPVQSIQYLGGSVGNDNDANQFTSERSSIWE